MKRRQLVVKYGRRRTKDSYGPFKYTCSRCQAVISAGAVGNDCGARYALYYAKNLFASHRCKRKDQ